MIRSLRSSRTLTWIFSIQRLSGTGGSSASIGVLSRCRRVRPAQAVEVVERLRLPVVRLGGLHHQQRATAARPVDRAVAVVPVEALGVRGLAAEAPRVVVDPGLVGVERGGHRQRGDARDGDDRGRGERGAAGQARQPQPGGDQDQQQQAAAERGAEALVGDRDAEQRDEDHEADGVERRRAAHRPERERGGEHERGWDRQVDDEARDLVVAVVRPLDRPQARHAAVDEVGEVVPVGGLQEVAGQADRHQRKRERGERQHGGRRMDRGARQRHAVEADQRRAQRRRDHQRPEDAAARRVRDERGPVGGGVSAEPDEGAEAQPRRTGVDAVLPRPRRDPEGPPRAGDRAHAARLDPPRAPTR